MAVPELTLIVAATKSMGIGAKGTLPWTGLKKEMAYFARVTKRVPSTAPAGAINAVIMGRKTWESIPPRFRPLKDRLNVVISRSHTEPQTPAAAATLDAAQPVLAASLDQALGYLADKPVARVFVIGGGQIYEAALKQARGAARRVLLTAVAGEFECDTVFPLGLVGDGTVDGGWMRRSAGELDAWVGEEVVKGEQEENGVKYEFQMWEKEDGEA
ncbi:hypothetical protein TD95_000990 [Thielaviopsis punctulata]|uniref:Dihydrofolate reductase n=1 Tax=Thielaviopsis punctulata TaxID=72032 RepID=A0A0F4ZD30_9PEZI|nr:hypothetical protein TD95_000990 [Thielaviopsis punctulata]